MSTIAITMATLVFSTAAQAQPAAASAVDRTFLVESVKLGNLEQELGRLAARKASAPEVREYARMIVSDHASMEESFTTQAAAKGVSVPGGADPALVSRLRGLSGKAFDREFIQVMIDVHRDGVRQFERAAQATNDVQIRNAATAALPTLRNHLDQARSIHAELMKVRRDRR